MSHKVSVIMGMYNCASTLSEAIDSIFAQTYKNWELILCDDGSKDNTYQIAKEYKDKYPEKIVLIQNLQNQGLNKTLNRCLKYVTGDYVARMDGDDVSMPQRFEKQVEFLDNHPEYAIVSTPMIYFDENGDWGRGKSIERPTKKDFVSGTPFCHAPCMVRAEAYRSVDGYSTNLRTLRAEDYDLWFRLYALGYKGYNLQEPYYKMRDDMAAYHRRKFRYCLNEAYVRFNGFRMLKLPLKNYIYVLRPIIVGLMPKPVYLLLHHRRQR